MRCLLIPLLFFAIAGCQSDRVGTPSTTQPIAQASTTRPSVTRAMEHRLDVFEGDALHDGSFRRAIVTDVTERGAGIVLNKPPADFPLTGTWTSETKVAEFPFTELLPSWNASVPDGSGVRFDVRVRDADKKSWSPWLYVGYWGRVTHDHRATEYEGGKVEVDTLVLDRPADAYEVRATLQDFHAEATGSPVVRKLTVVYSRASDAEFVTKPQAPLMPVTLDVPFRAQGVEVESIRHSICSPTSVSMVLAWAGVTLPTAQNAMAIWDDDYAIFGNWNRAVQYAGSLGCDAWLQRFATMDEARATLAGGQPIIASIRFKKGTFPSNIQNATAGHLIVLRGYDAHGDILVNDPASRDRGHGIIYNADELARAWLVNTGGAAYVIKKKI